MRRLSLVLAPFSFLAASAFAVVPVRAEDAPPTPDKPAEPAAPADPAKPAKKEFDDASIFADWKICKGRGEAHCRKRGEYWSGKGVAGKDLLWLATIWARGNDQQKAIDAAAQFLEWKPPADDAKGQETNAKNRPLAWTIVIEQQFVSKQYAKVIETAERFRTEQAESAANVMAQYGWQIPGHAARLSGDETKAIEFFTKAAELKFLGGVLDLVDVHLAAGRIDDAKAALAKQSEGLEKGAKEVEWMKGFLDAVGSSAPALAEGKNIAPSEAPTAWDRANILFHWNMQSAGVDRSLKHLEIMRKSTEGITVIGVATYKQYNPKTFKVEADLSEEKELEFYKAIINDTFVTPTPPSIVVKQEWLDAAKLKWDRQFLILDKEGKIRYARLNSEKEWDFLSVAEAAKKIAGEPAK